MQNHHAVVWLDHREARVFFFDRHNVKEIDFTTTNPYARLHHRAGSLSGHRTPEDQAFFHQIAEALKPAMEWLVMGPGSAKLEFVKHVHKHDHQLVERVVGVETAARAYFKKADGG
jgi:stalled ribosome rescue protein Dom34